MGHISCIPAEIIQNIFLRLPINLLVKLRYVCKRWNRLISDPYYIKSWPSDRKILLPFVPVDVLNEDDTTRSMVTLSSSPFANPEGKIVTFAGSCNGIVLLVIQDCRDPRHEHTHMVLYNPLTSKNKLVPDDLHSQCNTTGLDHVYGFGYGSTPDDVKIVRFRGCEYWSRPSSKNRHTCDVFSPKTNSWIMLKNFVQNANWLNDVGTFANGSLYWIANGDYNNQGCKIVALDVNNMVLSDIHVPCDELSDSRRYMSSVLGTLHGCLCIVAQKTTRNGNPWTHNGSRFKVWVMTEKGVGKSWLIASSLALNLKSEFWYIPVSILDNGIVLILINSFQELVIYDVLKHSHKVINISASPSYFRRSHGIEYVESLVSPSSLFNA